MKLRTGLTRTKLGVSAVIILLLSGFGFFLTRAAVLNEGTIRADITSRISAWTGQQAIISGPVRLSYFPKLKLTTGGFQLESAPNIPYLNRITAKAINVELGLWSLVSPEADFHRVIFVEPKIAIKTAAPDPKQKAAQQIPPLLQDALRAFPVAEIELVKATVTASGARTSETISDLNATASISQPAGAISGNGTFKWRQQALELSFSAQAPDPENKDGKAPVNISVRGPLVSAKIDGESTIADGLRVTGSLDVVTPDLRQFARWLGLLVPDGRGLGEFSASGPFEWRGHRIGFQEGNFSLDGNRALGALALDFGDIRPKIDGTLAFSAVELTQYQSQPEPVSNEDENAQPKKLKPTGVNFPLLHHLDLDLRVSTTEIETRQLTLGQTAFSITLNSGRFVADFATLDLCGGSGNGRFNLDAAVAEAPIRLTANVSGLAAETCIQAFTPTSPVSASTDFSIDLTSTGRTADALLRHLGGKMLVNANSGEMDFDLNALAARSAPERLNGWDGVKGKESSFATASAELIFRNGRIFSDNVQILSGTTRYSGEGTVDLTAQTLDLRLLVRDDQEQKRAENQQTDLKPRSVVLLKGPWSRPDFTVTKTEAGQ